MFVLAVFLIIILSVAWHTARLGISPMPSSGRASKAMISLIQISDGPIVELGSGWGALSYKLAKAFPDRKVISYEMSPIPYLISLGLKYFFSLTNLKIVRANFLNERLPINSTLVCYLYPGGMEQVDKRIELYCPAFLISNTFALPNKKADETIRLKDLYNSPIYFYRFKSL